MFVTVYSKLKVLKTNPISFEYTLESHEYEQYGDTSIHTKTFATKVVEDLIKEPALLIENWLNELIAEEDYETCAIIRDAMKE